MRQRFLSIRRTKQRKKNEKLEKGVKKKGYLQVTGQRISPNWRTFERHFKRAFDKQQEFDFIDEVEETK